MGESHHWSFRTITHHAFPGSISMSLCKLEISRERSRFSLNGDLDWVGEEEESSRLSRRSFHQYSLAHPAAKKQFGSNCPRPLAQLLSNAEPVGLNANLRPRLQAKLSTSIACSPTPTMQKRSRPKTHSLVPHNVLRAGCNLSVLNQGRPHL